MSTVLGSAPVDRVAVPEPACDLPLTRHAETRCKQRGIRKDIIGFVTANFDRDCEAREGAAAISISRKRLRELETQGVPVSLIERAARTVLIVAADGGIITAINRPNSFAHYHYGAQRLGHRQFRRARNRLRNRD
jgi:hypothetical protein